MSDIQLDSPDNDCHLEICYIIRCRSGLQLKFQIAASYSVESVIFIDNHLLCTEKLLLAIWPKFQLCSSQTEVLLTTHSLSAGAIHFQQLQQCVKFYHINMYYNYFYCIRSTSFMFSHSTAKQPQKWTWLLCTYVIKILYFYPSCQCQLL